MGWEFQVNDRAVAALPCRVLTLPIKPDQKGKLWYTVEINGRAVLVEQGQLEKVENGNGT